MATLGAGARTPTDPGIRSLRTIILLVTGVVGVVGVGVGTFWRGAGGRGADLGGAWGASEGREEGFLLGGPPSSSLVSLESLPLELESEESLLDSLPLPALSLDMFTLSDLTLGGPVGVVFSLLFLPPRGGLMGPPR